MKDFRDLRATPVPKTKKTPEKVQALMELTKEYIALQQEYDQKLDDFLKRFPEKLRAAGFTEEEIGTAFRQAGLDPNP